MLSAIVSADITKITDSDGYQRPKHSIPECISLLAFHLLHIPESSRKQVVISLSDQSKQYLQSTFARQSFLYNQQICSKLLSMILATRNNVRTLIEFVPDISLQKLHSLDWKQDNGYLHQIIQSQSVAGTSWLYFLIAKKVHKRVDQLTNDDFIAINGFFQRLLVDLDTSTFNQIVCQVRSLIPSMNNIQETILIITAETGVPSPTLSEENYLVEFHQWVEQTNFSEIQQLTYSIPLCKNFRLPYIPSHHLTAINLSLRSNVDNMDLLNLIPNVQRLGIDFDGARLLENVHNSSVREIIIADENNPQTCVPSNCVNFSVLAKSFPNLETIDIKKAVVFRRRQYTINLPSLEYLPSLRVLKLGGMANFDFKDIQNLSLTTLSISSARAKNLQALGKISTLKELYLADFTYGQINDSFKSIGKLKQLESLHLSNLSTLANIEFVRKLKKLKKLKIINCYQLNLPNRIAKKLSPTSNVYEFLYSMFSQLFY